MIEISIDYVKPGDILARNQTFKKFEGGMSSTVDLMKGFKLTESVIKKMKNEYMVHTLKIEDQTDEFKGLEVAKEYDEDNRQKTIKSIIENMNEVKTTGIIDLKVIGDLVENIINNVYNIVKDGKKGIATLSKVFSDVQTHDTYTWEHSVNSAIYSAVIAYAMPNEFNTNKIEILVFNMLLHDIGKLKIPLEILNKKEKLSLEEIEIIKKHPAEGYAYLRKMNEKLTEKNMKLIPSTYRSACIHHHQNYDGTGYPPLKINIDEIRPYSGREIPLVGRIAAVADGYDALTSRRSYRLPLHPIEVLKILESEKGKKLDPFIVDQFEKTVFPFPKGTTVNLSTNELGIVIGYVNDNKFQPIVRPYLKKVVKDGGVDIIRLFNRENIEISPDSKVQIIISEDVYKVKDEKKKFTPTH